MNLPCFLGSSLHYNTIGSPKLSDDDNHHSSRKRSDPSITIILYILEWDQLVSPLTVIHTLSHFQQWMLALSCQWFDISDIGKSKCVIFQDESLMGKTMGIKSDLLTGQEIADVFSKVLTSQLLTMRYLGKCMPPLDSLLNPSRRFSKREMALWRRWEVLLPC